MKFFKCMNKALDELLINHSPSLPFFAFCLAGSISSSSSTGFLFRFLQNTKYYTVIPTVFQDQQTWKVRRHPRLWLRSRAILLYAGCVWKNIISYSSFRDTFREKFTFWCHVLSITMPSEDLLGPISLKSTPNLKNLNRDLSNHLLVRSPTREYVKLRDSFLSPSCALYALSQIPMASSRIDQGTG